MNQMTIGADPELFMCKGDFLVSAINRWGGTKEFPIPLGIGEGFNVLEDNVMVEFNVPPASTEQQFVEHIQMGLGTIEDRIKQMGFDMSTRASGRFDKSELEDWQAFVFGCDPDYNAYTGEVNAKPRVDDDPTFRSCGGHIHVGCGKLAFEDACRAVAFCDLHLGIPSMFLDTDTERKKLYGKAGAFRVKPYGFEYRTLSNFWIFNSDLIAWVYHATKRAIEHYKSGFDLSPFHKDIQYAINNNDKDALMKLVKHFNLVV